MLATSKRLGPRVWAFPNTMLGLLAWPLVARRGKVRRVDGTIEMHGPILAWLLRHATTVPGGVRALTLGHVVWGRDQESLDLCRAHERVHVIQYERWGPFFLPAYLLSSLLALCRGRDPYLANRFEREAFARAPDRPQ